MKRSIQYSLILLLFACFKLAAQTEVSTVPQLEIKLLNATDGEVITLADDFVFEDAHLAMPLANVHVTIDGKNKNWTVGEVNEEGWNYNPSMTIDDSYYDEETGEPLREPDSENGMGILIIKNLKFPSVQEKATISVYTLGSVELDNILVEGRVSGNRPQIEVQKVVDFTVKNSVFRENSSEIWSVLLVRVVSRVFLVENTIFEGNNVTEFGIDSGGAIVYHGLGPLIGEKPTVTIKNSYFKENYTKRIGGEYEYESYGGAIKLRFYGSSFRLEMYENIFEANSAYYGGAIYMDVFKEYSSNGSISEIVLRNNTFYKNEASGKLESYRVDCKGAKGGAICFGWLERPLQITISDSYFKENRVFERSGEYTADGGAIAFSSPYWLKGQSEETNPIRVEIKRNTFEVNQAENNGGAFFAQMNRPLNFDVTFRNNTFYKNESLAKTNDYYSVSGGGAVSLFNSQGPNTEYLTTNTATFENNTFVENKAQSDGEGGAVNFSVPKFFPGGGEEVELSVLNGLFINNLFAGNIGKDANTSNIKVSEPNNIDDQGGNIGIDNGTATTETTEMSLGKYGVSYGDHGTSVEAGTSANKVKIPTLLIIPEGSADEKGVADITDTKDQRGMPRGTTPYDAGATEIDWVKYDANGGWFGLTALTSYNGTEYYEPITEDGEFKNKIINYFTVGVIEGIATVVDGGTTKLKGVHPEGKPFKGWATASTATEADPAYAVGNALTYADKSLTLYAVWGNGEIIPEPEVTVTYYPNGGGGTPQAINCSADGSHVILDYKDLLLDFTAPSDKHHFMGCNTAADGSGINYFVGTAICFSENIELYAQWSESPFPADPNAAIEITESGSFCPTNTTVVVSYELLYKDHLLDYIVEFSAAAQAVGFENTTTYTELPPHVILIPLPAGVPAGKYNGIILLRAPSGVSIQTEYPFEFEILNETMITTQPASVSGCKDDAFTLSVEAVGESLSYQWYREGEEIIGAVSNEYSNTMNSSTAGNYYVKISSLCGTVKSETVTVQANTLQILMKWDDVLYVDNQANRYIKFQWYKDGQAISKYGTSVYYTDTEGLSGSYSVRAYYTDDAYDESCPLVLSSTGTKASVKVYPNPVRRNSMLRVEGKSASADQGGFLIELYDLSGRLIVYRHSESELTTLPVNTASGVYLLHVTAPDGKKTVTKVVVK